MEHGAWVDGGRRRRNKLTCFPGTDEALSETSRAPVEAQEARSDERPKATPPRYRKQLGIRSSGMERNRALEGLR